MPSNEDLAWAAGFFDGEGCTTSEKKRSYPRIIISQSGDNGYESLQRFCDAVGLGKVYGPFPVAKNQTKIRWRYDVWGREKVSQVISTISPWLGTDKKLQAAKILGE